MLKCKVTCASAGGQDQEDGGPEERVPHTVHGSDHGGLLPVVLDAVRRRGHDGNVRTPQHHQPGGQRGAVAAGQEQHRHQPAHLHPHEQTGESASSTCTTALFTR